MPPCFHENAPISLFLHSNRLIRVKKTKMGRLHESRANIEHSITWGVVDGGDWHTEGNTTITPLMGTQISHKRHKCPNRGKCSYQQHSNENIFWSQRGEKGMDTRGSSQRWTRTWSRVEQHQTVCQSQMGGPQGDGVHGGEVVRVQGGTRRHRRKRRRGS